MLGRLCWVERLNGFGALILGGVRWPWAAADDVSAVGKTTGSDFFRAVPLDVDVLRPDAGVV